MARPRSPNPTVTVAARVPKVLDLGIEAMAADMKLKKSVLIAGWIARGYNAEKEKSKRKAL